MGFINLDLDAIEGYVANHLRLFISMAAGILVFVGIIAVSVFFIALRGAEQTMVPDVTGQDLTSALQELQVKELYPRIQLRYSQTSSDKGLILEQDPNPGTIVKAGRRIRLVVSQGVMINTMENYLGRNIDEVRMDLQTLFASEGSVAPLITLKEPLMYEYSAETPGTILQQRPEPGSGISGPTVLELVVSRGPEDALIQIPNMVNLSLNDVLEQIGRSGIDFTFVTRPAQEGEIPETVAAQNPPGGSMAKADTRVTITLLSPEPSEGEVFGLFKYEMAKNPYPLALRLEAQLPSGERRRLLSTEYAGGPLTVPYSLPVGTVLILYMLNREYHRETVIPQIVFQADRP
ncbi:MAG: PASTA domain-containing protein [Treponema sp.]|jgi:beta-lactam-binding protein with PASTA domain|nr:PASTA domain-containing protein [Treponema sp.]